MERGFSTLFATLALTLVVSSCVVLAQNDTTTQAPTPSEPVKKQNFVVHDGDKVCLRMTVAIVVNITYINTDGKNMSVSYPLTNHAEVNESDSFCHRDEAKAMVTVVPTKDEFEIPGYYVVFNFTGSTKSGDQHWAWGSIILGVDTYILDDLKGGDQGVVELNTTMALHGEPNSRVEFERSYTCDTNQTLVFEPKEKKEEKDIVALVYVSQLQVQAFKFRNDTSGEFDNARTCLLDSSGKANKIVPIAVGAALAGLVIVVLIAYLIGRLRSRRQSSYEALS